MGVNKKRRDYRETNCLPTMPMRLVIDKVEYMQTQQIDINDRSQFLNFLSFYESSQRLDLQFSDSKTIRPSAVSYTHLRAHET